MMNDSTYHSRSPQRRKSKIRPSRRIWPRSTANTPIWQVTLDRISTTVLAVGSGWSQGSCGPRWPQPLSVVIIGEKIENNAAKKNTSDDKQYILPTPHTL